jgi:hypothetical protein
LIDGLARNLRDSLPNAEESQKVECRRKSIQRFSPPQNLLPDSQPVRSAMAEKASAGSKRWKTRR